MYVEHKVIGNIYFTKEIDSESLNFRIDTFINKDNTASYLLHVDQKIERIINFDDFLKDLAKSLFDKCKCLYGLVAWEQEVFVLQKYIKERKSFQVITYFFQMK